MFASKNGPISTPKMAIVNDVPATSETPVCAVVGMNQYTANAIPATINDAIPPTIMHPA